MTHGIHHVTAIAGPAGRNVAFHAGVLGQRLVKRTVNFDDPGTYHLYFGDAAGSPGSILTFFPWEHAAAGRMGTGETVETAFRVPAEALPFWTDRLAQADVAVEPLTERFGAPVLAFKDPDGMRLALVGVEGAGSEPAWKSDGITEDRAIRGLYGVTLLVPAVSRTGDVLTEVLGFGKGDTDNGTVRFGSGSPMGGIVDLRQESGLPRGRQGAGSVHHVAFRAADDAAQAAIAAKLAEMGLGTTEQKDRQYFRSVYFREPGGVIFEIATDAPGFAVDEPEASLGTRLKLPGFLESMRPRIEAALPQLD